MDFDIPGTACSALVHKDVRTLTFFQDFFLNHVLLRQYGDDRWATAIILPLWFLVDTDNLTAYVGGQNH